jgi:hypothetical protein
MYTEYLGVLPIAEWLEKHASAVERTGQDRWQFRLNSGLDLTGTALLEQAWLRMCVRLDSEHPGRPLPAELLEGMLLLNATLPGGAKFSLGDHSSEAMLSAELPVQEQEEEGGEPVWLDQWIGEACVGLRQGALKWSILNAQSADTVSSLGADRRSTVDTTAEGRLTELCERAGWSFTTRASGQVAIRLDVRDAFCQALLAPKVGKMQRLRVSLGMATSTEGETPQAVHLLLLSASRLVRFARASAAPAGDATEYRWEAVLPADYTVETLGHALGALSVACQLTARELQAMEDRKIAREYLALRGAT